MKKLILAGSALVLLFISCKKDSSGTSGGSTALSGTWKFTSLASQTQATDEYNIGGDDFKDVTTSNYTSENNAGTITFSGNTAATSAVAYDVNTTLFLSSYEDNVLVDTLSSPLSISIPSSSGTSNYKVIGTDSVFFSNGFVTSADLTNGMPQAATPIGYKFHINGNVLTMTSAIVKDTVEDLGGGTLAQVHEAASLSVTLTKQ